MSLQKDVLMAYGAIALRPNSLAALTLWTVLRTVTWSAEFGRRLVVVCWSRNRGQKPRNNNQDNWIISSS